MDCRKIKTGMLVSTNQHYYTNNAGGTEIGKKVVAKITRKFYDPETGWRFIGISETSKKEVFFGQWHDLRIIHV